MVKGSNFEEEASYYSDDPVDHSHKRNTRLSARINQSLMVFVLLITSTIFLGSTLAANISLSGGRVEFGQGSAGLKACSASNQVGVKTRAEYTLSGHKLKSVELSNIPTSCYGYNIIVSILQPGVDGTNTLATLFSSVKRLVILDRSGTFYTSQADSSYVTLTSTNNAITSTDTVLISFNTPEVLTTDIGSIGIESSENTLTNLPCGAGGNCDVGGIGPGGGAIIYYQDTTFEAPGSPCNLSCQGLEIDQSISSVVLEPWTKNSSGGITTGSVGQGATGIGGGYANTKRAMTSANGSLGNTNRTGAMAYCWNKSTASATDRWYLPNVMEYAYIFKQVSDNSAFRSAFNGVPPSTDYYTSEEAYSGWDTAYPTIWNNGNPPPGISLLLYSGNGFTDRALSVEAATASDAMVPQNFAGYAKLKVWAHPKNAGYAVMCLRAFK
jgi:hypothetical protein